ncbi:MAG TPA: hypothetical protein VJ836_06960 [Candidatus Saccharimonadales bacterium]|nr:hypothetical protein [Candidatus Saccharimonadales bacterium]
MFGGHDDAAQSAMDNMTVQPTTDVTADAGVPATPGAPMPNFDTGGYLATDAPGASPAVAAVSGVADDSTVVAADDDLLQIKQQALTQLGPLVGHLDQTPEEKFRTTMMMIQASDNHALIKDAYTVAQQITDEKAKAQALLDIINEINYFTHTGQQEAGSSTEQHPAA